MHVVLLQSTFYPVENGRTHTVPYDGTQLNISLPVAGVPDDATEVILYVHILSGWRDKEVGGRFEFSTATPNGVMKKFMYYHTYGQSAASFNSENMNLPLGSERQVHCRIENASSVRIECYVQVIGYIKP